MKINFAKQSGDAPDYPFIKVSLNALYRKERENITRLLWANKVHTETVS